MEGNTMQRRLRFSGGAAAVFRSAGAADIGIVDSFDVRKREARLSTVDTAEWIWRPGGGCERQVVATEIAHPVTFEPELTAALLDDLREHGGLRRRARVV